MLGSEIALHFLIGVSLCFIGTIPFGPINLMVVKTTVEIGRRNGLEVAAAASAVEVMQALIAILFGMVINDFLAAHESVKFIIAVVFILLGIYSWRRHSGASLEKNNRDNKSSFKRGLLIAVINPQAAPFWIFVFASLAAYVDLNMQGLNLIALLTGIFLGKFLALYGFVAGSAYLKMHLKQSNKFVNRLLAIVLLLIGFSQLGTFLLT
ncbi:MAG: hypothetical protein COC19_02080 [SAR86 cluster bacterium]|uniref:Lysine transporter LysE n=1 Tax=SAR86 cluster bacterium TaxID=2030880 RepID=A0A2A4MT91_9GAMM|nr:MAG: hypothetical protein COC19_02080 [SAR86 cluster bacterium]